MARTAPARPLRLSRTWRRNAAGRASNGFAVTLTFPKDGDPLETTILKGNPGRIILM
jgi:hypothetical protein